MFLKKDEKNIFANTDSKLLTVVFFWKKWREKESFILDYGIFTLFEFFTM